MSETKIKKIVIHFAGAEPMEIDLSTYDRFQMEHNAGEREIGPTATGIRQFEDSGSRTLEIVATREARQ